MSLILIPILRNYWEEGVCKVFLMSSLYFNLTKINGSAYNTIKHNTTNLS